MSPRLSAWPPGAFTTLAALFIFSPVLKHGFIDWNDDILVSANPYIRGPIIEHLRWMFTSTLNSAYQPLGWILYSLIERCAGISPAAYHGASLILHAASTCLVYALALELLGESLAATLSALLFALHPVQVETVAWASCLPDLLCCALVLCSTLAYVKFARDERRKTLLWLSWALAFLAGLSRWEVVALPAALILIDAYVLKRAVSWKDKLPFFAISIGVGAVNAWAKAQVMHYSGFMENPQTALSAWLELLGHYFWPMRLLPVNMLSQASRPFGFTSVEGLIILSGLTAMLFILRKRLPSLWAAWLVYAAFTAPALSFSRDAPIFLHDRYAYLSCLGFALLAGAAFKRHPRIWPVAACLLLLLSAASVKQQRVWRNAETFWKHVLFLEPQASLPYFRLGNLMLEQGNIYAAISYFHEEARRNPEKGRVNLAHALNNLGVELFERGDTTRAQQRFKEALILDPNNAQVKANLLKAGNG